MSHSCCHSTFDNVNLLRLSSFPSIKHDHLNEIDISNCKLSSFTDPLKAPALTKITAFCNNFSGVFSFPEGTSLPSLRTLDLRFSFIKSLDHTVCVRLYSIHSSYCSCFFPQILSILPSLDSLLLTHNDLTVLPDDFSSVRKMTSLQLGECKLTVIPPSLAKVSV